MKTTPEKLEELKALAEDTDISLIDNLTARLDLLHEKDTERIQAFKEYVPALIADLEEARGMAVALAPDALREAEERKNIADGLEAVWRGRMQDAETAHQAELAATRKQLEELRAEYSVTLDNLSAAYESVRAQWNLGYAEGSQEVKHWRANHDNVVKKLRLFTQREDLPVDRLPAYEYVVELEKKLAEMTTYAKDQERGAKSLAETVKTLNSKFLIVPETVFEQPSELEMHRADYEACKAAGWESPGELLSAYKTQEKKLAEAQARIEAARKVTVLGSSFIEREAYNILTGQDTSALDAAIAEAIADEKRNPWKQAIINELAVSHVLHTDHETDPIKALAALVDYECKVALDPAVSKEAQELIEPYRKDAEQLDLLGKLCKETPLRPNAFCSEIAPDTRLRYDFPTLVSYDSVGNQISLRDAIDAAIAAAKGDSE